MSDEQENFIDYGDLLYVLVWNGDAKEAVEPMRPAPTPQFGPERLMVYSYNSALDSAADHNRLYASPTRKLEPMKLSEFLKQQKPIEPASHVRRSQAKKAG